MASKLSYFSFIKQLLILVLFIASFISCKKDPDLTPEIKTLSFVNITSYSAQCAFRAHSKEGAGIIEKGICWSTKEIPTIYDRKTLNGPGDGTFWNTLDSLLPNTTYYVCAYATTSTETFYGNILPFVTSNTPYIETLEVTEITYNSFKCGGKILSDGGSEIIEKGLCWGQQTEPTINSNKTIDSTNSNEFTCVINELYYSITYYVRAYATNSAGTTYGKEISFSTLPQQKPSINFIITCINQKMVYTRANITSEGGSFVFERGVCWSKTDTAYTADNKKALKWIGDSLTAIIGGLDPNTKYFIRPYAINEVGISYGNTIVVTTKDYGLVTDIEGNEYSTVNIGDQEWMTENLKVTHFSNGDILPTFTESNWIFDTSACYDYGNNPENSKIYGKLYNIKAALDSRKLCPTGWHIPTKVEYQILKDLLEYNIPYGYYPDEIYAGGQLKEAGTAHWQSPNKHATNETGFTALPGGSSRIFGIFATRNITIDYSNLGTSGNWWMININSNKIYLYYFYLQSNSDNLNFNSFNIQEDANSVRCIKD